MSSKSKPLDLSFLTCRGYVFGEKVERNSLSQVKFEDSNLACKIISQKKKTAKSDSEMLEAFGILKELSHPHIIPIHSVIRNGNDLFVFMQWINEENLLSYVKHNGMIKETTANRWFYQMVCAIKYLHSSDMAHCNLSCECVLISKENVKITGIDHVKRCAGEAKTTAKYFQSVPAYYLPPEVNDESTSDARKVDVFALGSILFIMLNAKIPFDASDKKQLVDDQMNRRFYMRTSNVTKLSVNCQVMVHTLLEPIEGTRWDLRRIYRMKWLTKFVDKHGDS